MEYGSNFELSYTSGKGSGIELIDRNNQIYLRSAREALFLIGKKEKEKGCKTIYMPSLCCSSMVQPFMQLGYEIIYYRLTGKLAVDYTHLQNILKENALLLVMNYYGIESFSIDKIKGLINGQNIRIIQDCTQHIFSDDLNAEVDYRIGSLRKWIAIPDGAYLMSRSAFESSTELFAATEDVFVSESLQAMKEKSEYIISGRLELKESYRKRNAFCMNYLKGMVVPHKISRESQLIYRDDILIDSVIQKRHENYAELRKALIKNNSSALRYAIEQHCPLCLPVVTANRDLIQAKLAEEKVYCQVLWPLPPQARSTCKISAWFSDHMLAVPCDQRYSVEDMYRIATIVENVMSEYAI